MKTLLLLLSATFLYSCVYYEEVGPRGPAGPQGPVGAQGESGYLFEFSDVNFVAPSFEVILPYPSNFEGLLSDVPLAYLLWDVQEVDGEITEIWRPLPQTLFTDFGTLQYNFDHTPNDIRLFLDANYPLEWLGSIDTDEWVVRVVIVPSEYFQGGRVGQVPSLQQLVSDLGLPQMETPEFDKKRN